MGMKNKTAPTGDPSPMYNGAVDDPDGAAKDYGRPYAFDPDFSGPVRRRSCTDIICLVLFLVFLGAWGFVAFVGMSEGDINKVLYPTDSMGRICGHGDLDKRPYLMFFDLTRCLNPAVLSLGCPTPQVCVEECPTQPSSGYALQTGGQEALAKASMKPYCAPMDRDKWNSYSAKRLILDGLCPAWVLPSKPILGRCLPIALEYGTGTNSTKQRSQGKKNIVDPEDTSDNQGIDEDKLKKAVTALGAFLSVRDFGERIFNDLSDTWWMIGLGFILACILSFLWIVLMRCMAGVMVWTSIGLVFVLVAGLFGYSLHRYLLVKDVADAQGSILEINLTPDYLKDVLALRDTWLAFVIILGILTGIVILVLIALRQRIQIAIQLIEQGSKAVGQMCSTIFWPIFPFTLHLGVVVWFAAVAMYLSSAGTQVYMIHYDHEGVGTTTRSLPLDQDPPDPPSQCTQAGNCVNPQTNQTYKLGDICSPALFNATCLNCLDIQCQFTRYEREPGVPWMHWFNLFAFFWAMEFVSALGELVLAGVFATWYWTFDKSQVPGCSLGRSFCNALTFHLGTVAFGSLIIAIIRFVRAVLEYIESKLKAYNNDLVKCLFCLCKCCLWCLEKFMKFINRNAYIMCAIKSTNFCVSAKDAFSLLMRNIVRVVVLNNVVNFLLFLGKLAIVAGVGTLSYFVFSGAIPELKDDIPTLNYLFTPIVCIVIGSYFITTSFFGVYAMAVDTLFLCFLEDLERNDGTPSRPYFMSKGLQRVVGKMQKFNADQPMVNVQSQPKLK